MFSLTILNVPPESVVDVVNIFVRELFIPRNVASRIAYQLKANQKVVLTSEFYTRKSLVKIHARLIPLKVITEITTASDTSYEDPEKQIIYNLLREIEALVDDGTLDQSNVDSNQNIINARIFLEGV